MQIILLPLSLLPPSSSSRNFTGRDYFQYLSFNNSSSPELTISLKILQSIPLLTPTLHLIHSAPKCMAFKCLSTLTWTSFDPHTNPAMCTRDYGSRFRDANLPFMHPRLWSRSQEARQTPRLPPIALSTTSGPFSLCSWQISINVIHPKSHLKSLFLCV